MAHLKAREAVAWHPEATSATAVARTEAFALHLCIAYARLLQWSLSEEDRLPVPTLVEQIFRLPRPPPIPQHAYAEDCDGVVRCVRCMLPPRLARDRPCRPYSDLGHVFFALGQGQFCGRCGAYSFDRVVMLGGTCLGRPQHNVADWRRRRRMLQGRHPKAGSWLGVPRRIDTAVDMFTVVLEGATAHSKRFF